LEFGSATSNADPTMHTVQANIMHANREWNLPLNLVAT
jgi:hypothetical protein